MTPEQLLIVGGGAAGAGVAAVYLLATAPVWDRLPTVAKPEPVTLDAGACEEWLQEAVHEEPRSYQQRCLECDGPPFTAAARHCPWCGTEVYDDQ